MAGRGTDRVWSPGVACALVLAAFATGCEDDTAEAARKKIRNEHLPHLTKVVNEDLKRQMAGMRRAPDRLAPGFQVEDPAEREQQMRTALKFVQEPPKGISQFVTSPMSFLAAVDAEGVVIARDAEPDRLKGRDMKKPFPPVRAALEEGEVGYALGEFEGGEDVDSSWSLVFAAPVTVDGERVGAVVSGIPLWRLAQRLSRQMRVDHSPRIEQGLVLWAYLIKGDRLFHMGTPPELDDTLPSASDLQSRLSQDDEGVVTGHVRLHGRTYGYGAAPLPEVGEDVALLVVRADP